MRFLYRSYPADPSPADQRDEVRRPALLVRVFGTAGEPGFPLQGILDTGSVECVLPYEVAARVRPTWIGGEQDWSLADYAGGEHPVRYGFVELRIRLEQHHVRWPAVVAFDRRRDSSALWGMAHFLQHFRITFDGPSTHFTIRLRGTWPPGLKVHPLARRPRGPRPPLAWHEQDP